MVTVELRRGGRIKRGETGAIELISPLPCPFNYGSVQGERAADGDLVDALVLGPPLPRGTTASFPVVGVVRFVDDGAPDDKLICSPRPASAAELRRIDRFFRLYALVKRAWGRAAGRTGRTAYLGLTVGGR